MPGDTTGNGYVAQRHREIIDRVIGCLIRPSKDRLIVGCCVRRDGSPPSCLVTVPQSAPARFVVVVTAALEPVAIAVVLAAVAAVFGSRWLSIRGCHHAVVAVWRIAKRASPRKKTSLKKSPKTKRKRHWKRRSC